MCEKTSVVKKQRNCYFNGFFHTLDEVYIQKQIVVVLEIPE